MPFPDCLHNQPLLISSDKSSIKFNLLAWLERKRIRPKVIAEFDDSALLKLFGQEGYGYFCVPTSIQDHLLRQYQVECIGVAADVIERYYAVSPERKIHNELAIKIVKEASGIISQSNEMKKH